VAMNNGLHWWATNVLALCRDPLRSPGLQWARLRALTLTEVRGCTTRLSQSQLSFPPLPKSWCYPIPFL